MKHIEIIYNQLEEKPIYGNTKGICRITGKESIGLPFEKWVKQKFTDHFYLHQGTIISNEAAFCFVERDEIIQKLTDREKPQNFRTYSHIIDKNGKWHLCTKSDKAKIVDIIIADAKVVCLSETGQKHIYFKHKWGYWQQDDLFVEPNIELFKEIHSFCQNCLMLGYNQNEVKTGRYKFKTVEKIGFEKHIEIDSYLNQHRGTPFFDFTTWLMYSIEK